MEAAGLPLSKADSARDYFWRFDVGIEVPTSSAPSSMTIPHSVLQRSIRVVWLANQGIVCDLLVDFGTAAYAPGATAPQASMRNVRRGRCGQTEIDSKRRGE
jgi:hypothetical protein